MDLHFTFNIAILAFTVSLLAILIPNIYFFEKIYNSGGTQNIGKHSALIMVVFNGLGTFLAFMFMIWAVVRMFSGKSESTKSSIY